MLDELERLIHPFEKRYQLVTFVGGALQEVIKVMGDELIAWRRTPASDPTGERQQHLDSFLVNAREGYRLMATLLLKGRKKKDELDNLITSGQLDESDAADDLAQVCALNLIKIARNVDPKAPFIPTKIDELLVEAARNGLPMTGHGAPISAYLHGVIFNSVASKISDLTKKAKKTRVTSENLVSEIDLLNLTVNDRRWGTGPVDVEFKVSVRQNVEIAKKVQDTYLDAQTYKGRKLRDLFGIWTPLDEWTESCDTKDRPDKKVIGGDFHLLAIR